MKSPWFKIPRPLAQARLRLFVFHHAGGSSMSYVKWRDSMPEGTELVLVELPGRALRYQEPAITDFKQLIELLRAEIEPVLDRPSIFLGHSLGALIAFELHRALNPDLGERVRGLALSSFLAPTAAHLKARQKISALADPEFIEAMADYAVLPAEVLADERTKNFYVSLIRRDIELIESYDGLLRERVPAFSGPRPTPLLILGGESDKRVPVSTLSDWGGLGYPMKKIQTFPGGHFYILSEYSSVIKLVLNELSGTL